MEGSKDGRDIKALVRLATNLTYVLDLFWSCQ